LAFRPRRFSSSFPSIYEPNFFGFILLILTVARLRGASSSGNGEGKRPCPVYIDDRLPRGDLRSGGCSQQRRIVNGHMDKVTKDREAMNHALFYNVSSLPFTCHRAQGIAFIDSLHDRHGSTAWNIPPLSWQRGWTTLYIELPDIWRRHPAQSPEALLSSIAVRNE
jgi:hypothetical protein